MYIRTSRLAAEQPGLLLRGDAPFLGYLGELGRTPQELAKVFSYPFWKIAEGKSAVDQADGSVTFVVNRVTIHLLPDRFLTEAELKKEGGTFERDGKLMAAHTRYGRKKTNFDPKTVVHQQVGNEFMVVDYTDPTFEIFIQTVYRKSGNARTLAQARNLRSGYGLGKTLQEHENWHTAYALDFIRKSKPTLPDMRGSSDTDFNAAVKQHFADISAIGTSISKYSEALVDCPKGRKAFFCK
jgi:hypothetical protein